MASSYEPPKLKPPREFRKRILLLYGGVFLLAAITLLTMEPERIDAAEFNISLVLKVFGPLIAIAAFMERALEVLVAGLRGGETERMERALESETPTDQKERVNETLIEYRHRTRRISFVTAVSAGLIISTLGIRSLEPFLVVDALEHVAAWQANWFSVVDVIITASLLGGGSDGIHKLMKLFTDYLDEASLNVRHQGKANRRDTAV